jgi:hypothetical protein
MLLRKCVAALAVLAACQFASAQDKDKKDTTKEVKGTAAKVVKVDADKKTAVLRTADGKLQTIKIGDDTKFIGPRGGESKEGIKDERFVKGAEVRMVMDPKTRAVKEIHLPLRKGDKDAKDKPKAK